MEKVKERKSSSKSRSRSSCRRCFQCERYRKELTQKDETIKRMNEVLCRINQLTEVHKGNYKYNRYQPGLTVTTTSPSNKTRRFSISQVNTSSSVIIGRHSVSKTERGRDHKETKATVRVEVHQPGNRKAQTISSDGKVITIQEIIDKVVVDCVE